MSWVPGFFSRHWRNVHFVAIALLATALIVNPFNITNFAVQVPLSVFYLPFFKLKQAGQELYAVAEENKRLQMSLVEASMRLSLLEESERENNRLKRILGFEPPSGFRLVPASIVSVTGTDVPMSATINRGIDHGLRVDQPVINEQGLIGRVSAVTRGFATVQLLTDPLNRVAVRASENRDMGIVMTEPDGDMVVDHISVQSNLQEGEYMISSGLGGVYPPGLLVGRVVRIEKPENEVFARVILRPAADFARIEELFVLRSTTE